MRTAGSIPPRRAGVHAPYRIPEASSGLLRLLQEAFALSTWSLSELAKRSNLPVANLCRHLHRPAYRELTQVETALSALGLSLTCRDPAGAWHVVLAPAAAAHLVRAGAVETSIGAAAPAGGFAAVLWHRLAASGLSLRAAQRLTAVPFTTLRRLVSGSGGTIQRQVLIVLETLGYALLAHTPQGDLWPVDPIGHMPALGGTDRHGAHLAALRRYRERHLLRPPVRPRRGQVQWAHARIVDLYRDQGLSCRRIAGDCGVSAERIRQILKACGQSPVRAQRIGQRRSGVQAQLLLTLPPDGVHSA